MSETILFQDYKFIVSLSDTYTDLSRIYEEMENDPYLKQFNARVRLKPSSQQGLYDLTISIPPESHGGPFGSSMGMFIAEKTRERQWFKNNEMNE